MTTPTDKWLRTLGYTNSPADVYTRGQLPAEHAYGSEIEALLEDCAGIGATAVYTVDGLPTVCFVEAPTVTEQPGDLIDLIRQKIWNQSLISLIIVVDDQTAQPLSVAKKGKSATCLNLAEASQTGPYSAIDVMSGAIEERHPDWFSEEGRVDRDLLRNLSLAVEQLQKFGMGRQPAQYVLGRCLFVSFLEHRGIVGPDYRERRSVGQLHELIAQRDRTGLAKLLNSLKDDFNGDFLQPEKDVPLDWKPFSDDVLGSLDNFLSRVDLETGQRSFWAYDFRYIPVELISGIYETFLDHESKKLSGAYYTPRHLANFAVDQVFADSKDVCEEVVYDGSCGSGILLATAYRRMLRVASRRSGGNINFQRRCELLLTHIHGSDIDETACRVTAFSLYLCLLENLQPVDIALLQEDEKVKLPPLLGRTIFFGNEQGDFFSEKNPFASKKSCTIYLSNPPWSEPQGASAKLSFETWSKSHGKAMSYRQIAIAFAHKAPLTVVDGGRFCLILNAKPFLSRSSQPFLTQWLRDWKLSRLINFSDIRKLLFPAASHPCVVAVGSPRANEPMSGAEEFEYWVPKSDVSLAFGRLTIHGIDRQRVQTSAIARDNQRLRSFFWGGPHDQALIARLRLSGTVQDLLDRQNKSAPRWISGKGFHHIDKTVTPSPPGKLAAIPFYDANRKPSLPVLDTQILQPFPAKFFEVASFGAHDGQLFHGPRVIFNDGASDEFEPQAFFSDQAFSFQSSVGAFAGPEHDRGLLKFFAVYLRSSLAKYVLLHTSYALATERTRVSMTEVATLPFVVPEKHRNPDAAAKAVNRAAVQVDMLAKMTAFGQQQTYEELRRTLDEIVFDYFGLNSAERLLVIEAVNTLIPSVQPSSLATLRKPTLKRATEADIQQYAMTLQVELRRIQGQIGGEGEIALDTLVQPYDGIGSIGICRISLAKQASKPTVKIGNKVVLETLDWLREQEVLPMPVGESFSLVSDFLFFFGDSIYLAKPLISRFWLSGQALRDATRIIDAIQAGEDNRELSAQ
ncbi:N-6 DNA methylase [Herminiimonas glaciei]|uniref:site-specific DNA-methyltransferase (adenine-specific) n=1 Tax=Herminiimonas glaciei TaxID=523788 RepID=A0ABW2IAX1_9BURK